MDMTFVWGFIAGYAAAVGMIFILFSLRNTDRPKQIKAPQQCFRIGSPVIVTKGPYQGMYGTIVGGEHSDRFMVHFPQQVGIRYYDFVHLDAKVLRINVPEEVMMEIEEQ